MIVQTWFPWQPTQSNACILDISSNRCCADLSHFLETQICQNTKNKAVRLMQKVLHSVLERSQDCAVVLRGFTRCIQNKMNKWRWTKKSDSNNCLDGVLSEYSQKLSQKLDLPLRPKKWFLLKQTLWSLHSIYQVVISLARRKVYLYKATLCSFERANTCTRATAGRP